jgi:hypothetical protein
VPLAGARLVRPLGIIHRRHQKLSANALRFIELLQQSEESNPAARADAERAAAGKRAGAAHRSRNGSQRASRRTVG